MKDQARPCEKYNKKFNFVCHLKEWRGAVYLSVMLNRRDKHYLPNTLDWHIPPISKILSFFPLIFYH